MKLALGLLLLTLAAFIEVSHSKPNTFVLHVDSKFTTESRWLATFTLHVEPYFHHLRQLDTISDSLAQTIDQYIVQFQQNGSNEFLPLFNLRSHQVNGCKTRYLNLRARMDDIARSFPSTLVTRGKRSLLPFLGNILSSITGTATESDIRLINDKLAQLDSQSIALKHIMRDSLSIVNATKIKTIQLTHAVNHINVAMSFMYKSLDNVTSMTYTELKKHEFFQHIWNQMDVHIMNLQRGLDLLDQEIDLLEQKIADVISFKVTPTLISPRQLKLLLIEVGSTLDKVKLPYEVHTELMQYYKYLSSSMFTTEKGLGIVISIPLISPHSYVDIYQIVNLPVPYINDSLLINHKIDHKYVAVNKAKTEIAYLTDHEFAMCTRPNVANCHINSPFRFVASVHDSCATTLITSASLKDCPLVFQPNDLVLPYAKPLHHGKWIVISANDITFTIFCHVKDSIRTVTVKAPLDFVHLSLGCYARSLSLLLPPTYNRPSHVVFHPIRDFDHDNVTIHSYVPSDIHHLSLTKPKLLTDIVDQPMSINELQRSLDRLSDVPMTSRRFHLYWLPIVIVTTLLAFGFGVWLLLVRYKVSPPSPCCRRSSVPSDDSQAVQLSTVVPVRGEALDLSVSPVMPASTNVQMYPNLYTQLASPIGRPTVSN